MINLGLVYVDCVKIRDLDWELASTHKLPIPLKLPLVLLFHEAGKDSLKHHSVCINLSLDEKLMCTWSCRILAQVFISEKCSTSVSFRSISASQMAISSCCLSKSSRWTTKCYRKHGNIDNAARLWLSTYYFMQYTEGKHKADMVRLGLG